MAELFIDRYVYVLFMVLLVVGLYGAIAKRYLVRQLLGLLIFQSAVFLFFIQGSAKRDARVPVIDPEVGAEASMYVNPLPHLMILTAIVVGAAIAGVGIAFLIALNRRFGTLDEEPLRRELDA
jgi:multicomponent Na+:H+ antiporter subunit C